MSDFHLQSKLDNTRTKRGRDQTGLLLSLVLLLVLTFAPTATQAFDRHTPVVLAVQKVGPAVVNISSEYEVHNRGNPFGNNPFFDNFFQDFLDNRPQKRVSLGSGVIIDGKRGFILTNAHVIEGATTIKAQLQDERQFEVRLVGADPDSDLAVLQINAPAALPSVEMGNSDDILIGETIIAIGNPFGFSNTVTTGVISAIDRSIKSEDRIYHEFIQTDASINPGNSGGPLLNINGELIGINTAIYAKAQGIGFAIPINRAKRIITDLIQYGHVVQGWIGVVVQEIDARMANYMDLKEVQGVLVNQVEEGSPAAQAGVESGDIIVSLQRRKVTSVEEYMSLTNGITAGETATITRLRNKKPEEVLIKTIAYPENRVPQMAWRRLGVEVEDLDPALRRRFHISAEKGVAILKVSEKAYLARIGVAPGDVILQMDENTITSKKDFAGAMIKCRLKSALLMLVQRNDQVYHLSVRMAP